MIARKRLLLKTMLMATALASPALAGSNIAPNGTFKASQIGGAVNPDFAGGTLTLDTNTSISNDFTVENVTGNTMDEQGHSVTFSGVFSGEGPLTFSDTVGGGKATFTGANTYTGATTINAGATLALTGTGTLSSSSGIFNAGTFDISGTNAGASIALLSGSGQVLLGAQNLTITSGSSSAIFSGVISGSGALIVNGGTQILSGANVYTGGTVINSGTLQLGDGATAGGTILGNVADNGTLAFNRADAVSFTGLISGSGGIAQNGTGTLTLTQAENYTGSTSIAAGSLVLAPGASIANSSTVNNNGLFDISQTSGASIKALAGTGTVNLGAQTLTFTGGSGTFSGVIQGSGGITVLGGTETLSGVNTYTGTTNVVGGTLQLGGATIGNAISNSGTVAFFNSSPIVMNGVISGTGNVMQTAAGTTTITAAQSYSGLTTITAGTLALSGSGSIASSSGLVDNGGFDITAATGGASIVSLDGSGTVQLGSQVLTLTNASGTFNGKIQGAGDLVLVSGKETLGGINAFTGITTIQSGTMYLTSYAALSNSSRVDVEGTLDIASAQTNVGAAGASLISLAGGGSVVLGPSTLTLTNAADTFSGTISGTGGLTVSGGTETLTGNNTYTGATTISGGTLVIAGGGSLAATGTVAVNGVLDVSGAAGTQVSFGSLAGTGRVTLGGKSLALEQASGSFGGTITGTGGLIINGGSQTLAGANNYTGGTVINAGTLQIGDSTTGGSILGDVTDNGMLSFNRSDSSVFSGAISGSGAVSQLGRGTTILTAANSYGGGTTISNGTLQVGNGGTTGSITGNVTDNGTLAFSRADAVTFTGTISGTGGVSQIGTGTLTLTAVNSYTGATSIAAGSTLVLAPAASIASSSNVADDGVLDLTNTGGASLSSLSGAGSVLLGSGNLTILAGKGDFSGAISGSGLTVKGGNQTLSGVNAITGPVAVTGGTLTVNGALAGAGGISVGSGGTLAGSGTVSSVAVASGGTLAPGAGLKVAGNVTLASGSTYLVSMSSAGASSLSASGTAALGGTLGVASSDGTYLLGQKLTVLTAAGGISGSFTAAPLSSGTGAQFASTISYDASNVYLQVNLAKLSPLLPTTATRNQAAPVAGIDAAIAAGNTVPVAIQSLGNLTSAGLAGEASQINGEIGADAAEAGQALQQPFLNAIFDHLQDSRPRRVRGRSLATRPDAWLSGFAGSDLVQGDAATDGSHKFKSQARGFAAGADWPVSSSLSLGGAVSYGTSDFHLSDALGSGTNNAFQAAGYGWMQFSPRLYGAFAGVIGIDKLETHRAAPTSGQLDASFNSYAFTARYETGLSLGGITPYAALEDSLFTTPSYRESASVAAAGDFALAYRARTANSGKVELGVRQSGNIPLDDWTLSLSDRLAWGHGFSSPDQARVAFAALPASDFTVQGAQPGRDTALLTLGAALKRDTGISFNAHFESAVSGRSQSFTGMGGISVAW